MNYVYLIKKDNKVIYVGETKDPIQRLKTHKYATFKDKTIVMDIVEIFSTRTEARKIEEVYKKWYNFELTEKIGGVLNGRKAVETGQIYKVHNKNKKPILMYDKNMNFIKEYDSSKSVCLELKLDTGCVCKVLKRKLNHTRGYIFRYKSIQSR